MSRKIACLFVLVIMTILSACEKEDTSLKNRQWLTNKTREFKTLYAVAYEQIEHLQNIDNPCGKGADPKRAALFHAVLQNLNKSFTSYKNECEVRLGKELENDALIREHLQDIEKICQPFSDNENLAKCGQVEEKTAREFFKLKNPIEFESAAVALERRIEMK